MGQRPTGTAAAIQEPATLSTRLVRTIDEFCDALESRPGDGPAVVHLRGAASPPATGPAWPGDVDMQLVTRWERALRRLERAPAATVAVTDAHCHGAALEIMLCVDYRVAVADTRLHLASAAGTWPGMGLYRLANQIGPGPARRLTLFQDELTAAAAVAVGLVDRVVADRTAVLAAVPPPVAATPGPDLAIRRHLLLEATAVDYDEALGSHLAACDRERRRTAVSPLAGATARTGPP